MNAFNILDAKSNLSRLVSAVETGDEAEMLIARNGRPVARLVPVKPVRTGKRIGVARGKFLVPDTIDADEDAIAALFHAV
jgi:prevent-host-death family protein